MVLSPKSAGAHLHGRSRGLRIAGVAPILVAVSLAAAVPCAATHAQQDNKTEHVFQRVSPSVVVVLVKDAQGEDVAQGSGVVIGVGEVITNCHVTKAGPGVEVHSGKKEFAASVRFDDSDRDLCQLSVPGLTAPSVTLGTVKSLRVGERVFAVGAPEGLDLTMSEGIISSLRHVGDSVLIQTTAPISPGSSGGGLFDVRGRLVGITSYQMSAGQNLNFALPADWISAMAHRSTKRARGAHVRSDGELGWIVRAASLEAKRDWTGLARLSARWAAARPDDELAWIGVSEALEQLEQYGAAAGAATEATRLEPGDASAWLELGFAHNGLGQYERAVQAYTKVLQLQPDQEQAWAGLGFAYNGLGGCGLPPSLPLPGSLDVTNAEMCAKATTSESEAVRLDPEDEKAWLNLGVAYLGLKEYGRAAEAQRRAIRLKPGDQSAWFGLGVTYCFEGDRASAIRVYQVLQKLAPKTGDLLFRACIAP